MTFWSADLSLALSHGHGHGHGHLILLPRSMPVMAVQVRSLRLSEEARQTTNYNEEMI